MGSLRIDLPPIVVSIRTPYAVTLHQVVDVQDTMQLIKAKIEEALGLSASRQRLTLRAQSTRALSDSARVGELQENTLDLYDIRGDDPRNCGVRLTIVTLGGVAVDAHGSLAGADSLNQVPPPEAHVASGQRAVPVLQRNAAIRS